MDDKGCQRARSQTPFGNALAGETLFRVGGESACWPHRKRPADTPACETEFRSQVRSQTEFGNERVKTVGLSSNPRTPQ